MTYEEELRARLDAVRPAPEPKQSHTVDVSAQEQKMFDELASEFEFSRYDLDESDILRTLKTLDILERYHDVFRHKRALRLFYTLSRIEVVTPKKLHAFSGLPAAEFKAVIQAMARYRLVFKNETGELELTMDGKSLASRIGLDIFL